MHLSGATYEELYSGFRWDLPEQFNVAEACCFRHARSDKRDAPALFYEREDGTVDTYSFGHLEAYASRFANLLAHLGVGGGDIVGVHLPQTPEALIAHLGIQTVGAIALPLFALFGPDAMQFRLTDSRAKVLVSNMAGLERTDPATSDQPALEHVLCIDGDANGGAKSFWALMENASPEASPVATGIDDPAFLMYTSGTTGNPKGV
ncbi:MAG: AMP-binding protein, partial [Hyphomicrobiaceae bacterium]